jgi:tetratricopeptide (TPR) repeat protein
MQSRSVPRASRKLVLAVPVSLLFSALCFAQTTAIQGFVTGEDGKPLAGAVIKLDRTDVTQHFTTKTDKKGHYFYGGFPYGSVFNVTVEVGGQVKDAANNVKPPGSPQEVDFDLKAVAEKAAKLATAPAAEVEKGMTPAQKAEYERKKKEAEAAIAKNKDLNDAFNAGMEAEMAKKYDAAIEAFEKAVMIAPEQHVVWSHLADNYSSRATTNEPADAKQADMDKAVADYKKAIEIEPNDPTYHNNYALVLARDKKMDEAKDELGQAAKLDPGSAGKYYFNLGAVMANINQNDAAQDAFKKAMDAGYVEAYYQYGLVMVGKATATADGKIVAPDGTVQAFQKYLELAPTGPNAQSAKELLTTLGAGVQTTFQQPGAKKK